MINDNPQIPEEDKQLLCTTCTSLQRFNEVHTHLEDGTPCYNFNCVTCGKFLTRMIFVDGNWKLDTTVYGRKGK